MDKGKVIIGALAGLAAGTLLGMLMAPNSGSETRKKLVKKGSDSLNDLKDKVSSLMEEFNSHAISAKEDLLNHTNKAHAGGKEALKTPGTTNA